MKFIHKYAYANMSQIFQQCLVPNYQDGPSEHHIFAVIFFKYYLFVYIFTPFIFVCGLIWQFNI